MPESNYFSRVQVTNIDFPNAPDVDVRFEAKTLGTIAASKYETFNLNAGQGRLKIYKANTDTLLADTLVTLTKNTQQSFRFGYSEEFGFKGFVYAGAPISQDTVAFQILNNLGDYYKTYSIDLHICVFNFDTGNPDETGYVINDFMKTRLSPNTIRLPYAAADGTPYYYLGRLYDRATGTFIVLPSGSDYFLFLQEYGGAYYIYNVHDDAGDVSSSTIYL
ncbi:hypothetical protein GCM10022209_41270 [Chitinophaga oryziterrae]